jgi:salicylate hydroxylase
VRSDRRLVSLATGDSPDSPSRLVFEDATANRHELSATAVIAADGLKSIVRSQLFGASAPRFGGFVAWRGLVPLDALSGVTLSAGSKVFAGPGRLFVRYPVRRGRLMNYVAFARVEQWQPEGWSQTGTVAEAAALLQGFHPEVHAILAATPEGRCHKWGLFAREPLPEWTRGCVALLGDAAHPMMPWFGQGAASALEDAVILGRCVMEGETAAGAPVNGTPLATAFRRYQRTRHARVTLIHHESAAGGERLSGMQPERLRDQPVRNEDSLGLFSYDPVSETLG